MDALQHVQQLQLKLIRSASVNENCAIDLVGIVYKLNAADAKSVFSVIELLLNEAELLRRLSRDVTASRFFSMCC